MCPVNVNSDYYLNKHPWCLETMWMFSLNPSNKKRDSFGSSFSSVLGRRVCLRDDISACRPSVLVRPCPAFSDDSEFQRSFTPFRQFSLRCLPLWGLRHRWAWSMLRLEPRLTAVPCGSSWETFGARPRGLIAFCL